MQFSVCHGLSPIQFRLHGYHCTCMVDAQSSCEIKVDLQLATTYRSTSILEAWEPDRMFFQSANFIAIFPQFWLTLTQRSLPGRFRFKKRKKFWRRMLATLPSSTCILMKMSPLLEVKRIFSLGLFEKIIIVTGPHSAGHNRRNPASHRQLSRLQHVWNHFFRLLAFIP